MISRRQWLVGAGALLLPSVARADTPYLPPSLQTLGPLPIALRDGTSSTIGEQLAPGRAAVISFWATWCAPCQPEARHLGRLRADTPIHELDILGINIDTQRSEININWFIERTGAHYPHVYGDVGAYIAFAGAERRFSLPRLYVFGSNGEPIAEVSGYKRSAVSRAVRAALGGR